MPSLKDIFETPGKVVFGAKVVAFVLLLIVALQGVTIWLLLTRLPAP